MVKTITMKCEDIMKKLLIGLLTLGSVSSFASVCSIKATRSNIMDKLFETRIKDSLDFTGKTLNECENEAIETHQSLIGSENYDRTVMKFWEKAEYGSLRLKPTAKLILKH